MDNKDKILEAANRLGHYLAKNDLVQRYRKLSEDLEKDEEARKLVNEYIEFSALYQEKEKAGTTIEVEEKRRFSELSQKIKDHKLLSEFFATQSYYMILMQEINERIAHPEGDPPKESTIITPGEDRHIIL